MLLKEVSALATHSCPAPAQPGGWHPWWGCSVFCGVPGSPAQSCVPAKAPQLSGDETWASPGSAAAAVMSSCLWALAAPDLETCPRSRQKGLSVGKSGGCGGSSRSLPAEGPLRVCEAGSSSLKAEAAEPRDGTLERAWGWEPVPTPDMLQDQGGPWPRPAPPSGFSLPSAQ